MRITQLDGKLPNLALMRLSAWHKARGDDVRFYRSPYRELGEPEYAAVYGSAIFSTTERQVARLLAEFPNAIIGGTGSSSKVTVEDIVGDFEGLDYGPWPKFSASIGFTQRGCRLSCKFCVVPKKEGKPAFAATIADIWRGDPTVSVTIKKLSSKTMRVTLAGKDGRGEMSEIITKEEARAMMIAFDDYFRSEEGGVTRSVIESGGRGSGG